jgi:DNA-binding NtrC family response regulator
MIRRTAELESAVRVLVVGGEPPLGGRVRDALIDLGVRLDSHDADIVVVLQTGGDTVASLMPIRRRFDSTPIIVIAEPGSEAMAVDAFRAGADDYLAAPVTADALAASLARVRPKKPVRGGAALIGESEAITNLRAVIRRIGATPCNVLIEGETGTGKDVVARLLHEASPRAAQAFVTINCSAVPDTLFESELFGYERGAFTGAHTASAGRLQAGNGGTIFLDEVGELGMPLQPKLLRAIDQREVQRLGSRRHETIDVRWVAATNRDLQQSVRSGLFRADLFYRLNVYSLVIPPLRERPEDILILARAFLAEIGPAYARGAAAFTDDALLRLVAYDWPGNVRQLRNVVESSLLNTETDAIGPAALPAAVRGADISMPPPAAVERVRVVEALRAAGGNKSEAAQRLQWSRMTLYRKLARHRIDVTATCDSVTLKSPVR